MKAAILEDWEKISIKEIPQPEILPGEALLRVTCAAICGSDVHIFHGKNPIAQTPVIPGHEFTGEVAFLSDANSNISVGSKVAVQPLKFCGECTPCKRGIPHVCEKLIVIGVNQNGGFAEYARVPTDILIEIPAGIPDEVAVLAEPFSVGYHTCRRGQLREGQHVLVIGGGPIGLYAAIVARELGASDIVVSEPNANRRALVEAMGIAAIDPLSSGSLEQLRTRSNEDGYDLVVETSGVDSGLNFAVEACAVRGNIVSLGFPAENYAKYNITRGIVKELSLIGSRVCPRNEFRETLELLKTLYERGDIDFGRLVTQPRKLEDLARSIMDVSDGTQSTKILIKPE